MSMEAQQKVSASHLKRSAYLYVRQSTMRQVLENTESTQRQYALRQRAVALGSARRAGHRHRYRSRPVGRLGRGPRRIPEAGR